MCKIAQKCQRKRREAKNYMALDLFRGEINNSEIDTNVRQSNSEK